jgi:glycosyltransferase involved in cell wall biosynthesis
VIIERKGIRGRLEELKGEVGMVTSAGGREERELPRTLAGATVLQIVPSLREGPAGHVAVNVAEALIKAGARAIVASDTGPLAEKLVGFGGEWISYPGTTFNPLKLRRNVEWLAKLLMREPIDIVHAKSAGAAWCALPAVERVPTKFVTELPDLPYAQMLLGAFHLRAVSSGDRVIVHSLFDAQPMVARYNVSPKRIKVIARGIDVRTFDPAAVVPSRVAALRQSWGVPSGARVVLIPGRVSAQNGQITAVAAARILTEQGMRGVTFVVLGDDKRHPRYVQSILKQAQAENVFALFRIVGELPDMPSALAAADIVVTPYVKPPVTARVAAEAQAMARPVVASSVGALPEALQAPPDVAEEFRTGWVVPPNDPAELARALGEALRLDDDAYRALALRARKSAVYLFSPESVVTATLDVYNSLLQSGT